MPRERELFFNHVAAMPQDEYVREMAGVLEKDETAYEALARNLHNQSIYLLQAKYRYLTMSYLAFLVGVIAATVSYVANAVVS